ncbi:hypothetical protein AcV7_007391 [Taiwanofungus camphoratus]|nr:hypothetical protein AcV7_007391 [Antrodia cinnamomea]
MYKICLASNRLYNDATHQQISYNIHHTLQLQCLYDPILITSLVFADNIHSISWSFSHSHEAHGGTIILWIRCPMLHQSVGAFLVLCPSSIRLY